MKLVARLHDKLGDLWWYSILFFCAARFADVINMFVGLWIVPRYVPVSELGAVLPLTQAISFIGIPLAILSIPFSRYLTIFLENNLLGEAKSFVRDVFAGAAILTLVTVLFAGLILPLFFERIRVVEGSLGWLVIVVCVLSSVSGVIGSATQGLRLYNASVWISLAAAPLRLVLMLIFMPFRALSGYMVGQSAPAVSGIVGSVCAVWKFFQQNPIRCEPYWRKYGRSMLKYTLPIAIWTAIISLSGSIDSLVIRHRLTDHESAAYYMITRFSDIGGYFGAAFTAFLFPMVAGKKKSSSESRKLLRHSILGSFGTGVIVAILLGIFGKFILMLQPMWSAYVFFVPHMAFLALYSALTMAGNCCVTYRFAQGEFGFLKFAAPFTLLKIVFLYSITGYGFFKGIVPDSLIAALEEFNPCRLSVVIFVLLVAQLIFDGTLMLQIWKRKL